MIEPILKDYSSRKTIKNLDNDKKHIIKDINTLFDFSWKNPLNETNNLIDAFYTLVMDTKNILKELKNYKKLVESTYKLIKNKNFLVELNSFIKRLNLCVNNSNKLDLYTFLGSIYNIEEINNIRIIKYHNKIINNKAGKFLGKCPKKK